LQNKRKNSNKSS